jgi:glycosyltransferase involved in cell wall biosynthesis
MHVVVVTVAHRGDDARIVHRQARMLCEAGHRVTLIAPDPGGEARRSDPAGLVRVTVPRAVGRRRVKAWRAARRELGRVGGDAEVVLIHDPELVPVTGWGVGRRRTWRQAALVWDVHEDFVASVEARWWIPRLLRPVAAMVVRAVEWVARRRFRLLLAEDAYAERLGDAPVVPNSTWVPEQVAAYEPPARAVYVGRVSQGRGVDTLIAVGRELRRRGTDVTVELIGAADADVRARLQAAHDAGDVVWRGPLPNPEAMNRVQGALAGLALLHDEANYRHSRPTKCVEYLANAVPVITTPLPLAAELIERSGGGAVTVDVHGDGVVAEVVACLLRWRDDPLERARLGAAGHAYVAQHHNWQRDGPAFVGLLESYGSGAPR